MSSPTREKIIISSCSADDANQNQAPNPNATPRKWRVTGVGLTPLGGLLAFGCLVMIIMAPKFLSDFFVSGFWNNAYGTRRAMFFSDIISWAILDQDSGYIGSYAIGSALAVMSFYCLSQILESLGYMVYREGDQ